MPTEARYQDQTELAAAIKALREQAGLSQAALGRRSNIDLAEISRLESGRVDPTWGMVRRIAGGLGVTMKELAERSVEIGRRKD
jgi:transcriptional regulator with XRE-family HTH domain